MRQSFFNDDGGVWELPPEFSGGGEAVAVQCVDDLFEFPRAFLRELLFGIESPAFFREQSSEAFDKPVRDLQDLRRSRAEHAVRPVRVLLYELVDDREDLTPGLWCVIRGGGAGESLDPPDARLDSAVNDRRARKEPLALFREMIEAFAEDLVLERDGVN